MIQGLCRCQKEEIAVTGITGKAFLWKWDWCVSAGWERTGIYREKRDILAGESTHVQTRQTGKAADFVDSLRIVVSGLVSVPKQLWLVGQKDEPSLEGLTAIY